MSEEKKASRLVRLGLFIITSPVNIVFGLVLAYFALKVYVFGGGFTDKLMMFGVVGLWMFWFIAKHMLVLLLVLVLLGGGAYWYYSQDSQTQATCEQEGRVWNVKTKTCEDAAGWWNKLEKTWDTYQKAKKIAS